MSLVRAWMRALSGASGAALLVPLAVFGSMVMLALAGGFGQLGGLRQALAGPSLPSSPRGAAGPGARGANGAAVRPAPLLPVVSAPTLVASVRRQAPAAAPGGTAHTGSGSGAAGAGGGGGGRGNGGGGGGRGNGGATGPGNTTGPPPANSPSGSAGSPTPSPPGPGGAPAPPPTLIDSVVSLGTSITSRIPGPIGQLASATLEGVGSALEGLLPSADRPASSAVGAPVDSTVSQVQSGAGQLGSGVTGLLHSAP